MPTKLSVIYESPLRDTSQKLRELAAAIDARQYGEVACVAVVMLADEFHVLGFGPNSESPSVCTLLLAGANELADAVRNRDA